MEINTNTNLPRLKWEILDAKEAKKRKLRLINIDNETTLLSIDIAYIPRDMPISEYIDTICNTGIVMKLTPSGKPVKFKNKMLFSDLKFKTSAPGTMGIQAVQFFPNGYGVSVIRNRYSYGNEEGLYEVAIICGDESNWNITYDTPITDDVIGYCDELDVEDIMAQVEKLPKYEKEREKNLEEETHCSDS